MILRKKLQNTLLFTALVFALQACTESNKLVAGSAEDGSKKADTEFSASEVLILGPSSPTNTSTPSVSWNVVEVPGVSYELAISKTETCEAPYVQYHVAKDLNVVKLEPLLDGTYYACLSAKFGKEKISPVNNAFSFSVNAEALESASNSSTHTQTGTDLTSIQSMAADFAISAPAFVEVGTAKPTLEWTASQNAVGYNLKVSTKVDCSAPLEEASALLSLEYTLSKNLVAGTTYYVCLDAIDSAGVARAASNSKKKLRLDTAPPAAFAISGPQSPALSNAPSVSWQSSSDAVSYTLVLDTEASCSAPHINRFENLTETSKAMDSLADSTYHVCVFAYDLAKNETAASNNGYSFVVSTNSGAPVVGPIGAFSISSPSNANSVTGNTTPTITWQLASGASSYDVVVASDAACSSSVQSYTGVTTLSKTLTALTAGEYFICVTAKDAALNSKNATNNHQSLTVDLSGPAAFNITGPISPALSNSPSVSWQSPEDAVKYTLVVDTDVGCAAPHVTRYENLSSNSKTLDSLPDGTYHVCATAFDSAGNATVATNSGYSFVVSTDAGGPVAGPIGSFSLTYPTNSNSITGSTTPTVTWQLATGATNYDLVVASDAACSTAVQTHTGITSLSKTLTALSAGEYFICVTAKDASLNSKSASNNNQSMVVDLTGPAAFNITGPITPTLSNTPGVSWQSSSDAAKYTLVVDTDVACAAPHVNRFENLTTTSKNLEPLPDSTYYVCAYAYDSAGNQSAATNNGYSFVVNMNTGAPAAGPIGSFSISNPAVANSVTGSTTPTVSWQIASGATHYDLVVASDVLCTTAVQTHTGITTLSKILTTLSAGEYFICVTAKDASSNSKAASNNHLSLTVDLSGPSAFNITGPISPTASSAPNVSWQAPADAVKYTLVVDTEAACNAPHVSRYENLTSASKTIDAVVDNTYYLCAFAYDAAGNQTGATNNGYTLTVDAIPDVVPDPIGAFSITGPSTSSVASVTPTISWTGASGATAYDLIVATDGTCSTSVQTYSDLTTLSQALTTLTEGLYTICLTAKDASSNTRAAANNKLAFGVDVTGPASFSISAPSLYVRLSPVLASWSAPSDASSYDLKIASNAPCTNIVYAQNGLTNSYHSVSDLPDGAYYLCVTAKDALGNATQASNTSYAFVKDTNPPSSFSISSPSGDLQSNTPMVTWTSSSGSSSYDVYIDTDASCAAPYTESSAGVTATNYQITTNLADNTYYVCVTAKDVAGNTTAATNSGQSFRVDSQAPGAFSVTHPANNSTNSSSPLLVWGAAANANYYKVVVDDENTCAVPNLATYNNVTNTTQALSGLTSGQTYYACVTAFDSAGNNTAATNSPYSILVDNFGPGNFNIISPSGNIGTSTPTVTWGAAIDALTYKVVVDNEITCTAPHSYSFPNANGTSHTVGSALADGSLYLCVYALDAAGNSTPASNNGLAFSVDVSGPSAFDIELPSSGTTLSSRKPTISWESSVDAVSMPVKYTLTIDNEATCAAPHVAQFTNLSVTQKALESNLADGTYYACVNATDTVNYSTAATNNGSYSFTIDGSAPNQPAAPTDAGASLNGSSVIFNWTAPSDIGSSGVASYKLRIGTAPGTNSVFEGNVGNVLTYTHTALANQILYASVQAVDAVGNASAWSQASDGINVVVSAPVALSTFSAVADSSSTAVLLTLAYPSSHTYDRIVIRRAGGASAPADCSSGTVIFTVKDFSRTSFVDNSTSASTVYSYRACVYDAFNNVTSTNVAANVTSGTALTSHTVFVTSATFTGNLNASYNGQTFSDGLTGGDYRCTYIANQAGRAGSWKAILSSESVDANSRLSIVGPVYNAASTPQLVANNSADFWDGSLANTVQFNESSGAYGGYVWTGTNHAGGRLINYTCNSWTNGNGSYSSYLGYSNQTSSSWAAYTTTGSSSSYPLYCINQTSNYTTKDILSELTNNGSDASGNVSLTLKLDLTVATYTADSIVIRRRSGTTLPNANCSAGTDTIVTTIPKANFENIINFTDATGVQDLYSYRACAYNSSSAIVSTLGGTFGGQDAFVTSSAYSADLGGIIGADAKCQTAATLAGRSGAWFALISDSETNVADRNLFSAGIKTLQGGVVAYSPSHLWTSYAVSALRYDENGNDVGSSLYTWSGSTAAGAYSSNYSCRDWRYGGGTDLTGSVGRPHLTGANWIAQSNIACNGNHRLYCVRGTGTPRNALGAVTLSKPTNGAAGRISIQLNFANYRHQSSVNSIVIRRKKGAVAPAATCNDTVDADNAIVATLYAPFEENSVTLEDAVGSYGVYSYRACQYNSSGTLISQYRLGTELTKGTTQIFVTSNTHTGNMGGLSGADSKCQAQAISAGLPGTWSAVLSTTSVNAKDRFHSTGSIYNMQFERVATSITDIWDGTLDYHIGYTENKAFTNATSWTGSTSTGDTGATQCTNWTTNSSGVTGYYGVANAVNTTWMYNSTTPCNGVYPIYCTNAARNGVLELSITKGTNAGQSIATVQLASDVIVSALSRIDLKRTSDLVGPSLACSTGTLVQSWTSNLSTTLSITDTPGGNNISTYRACAYDANGLLVGTSPAKKGLPKGLSQIFVISASYATDGFMNGVSQADNMCNFAAAQASLGYDGQWKSVLSSHAEHVKNRFNFTGPILNVAGNLVASSLNDLWAGSLSNAVALDETGVNIGSVNVYTGTSIGGYHSGKSCSDGTSSWMSANAATQGQFGNSSIAGSGFISSSAAACNTGSYRYYCMIND